MDDKQILDLAKKHGIQLMPASKYKEAIVSLVREAIASASQPEWISVEAGLPDYVDGKDYSENVLGIYTGYQNKQYTQIFSRTIVEINEDGHQWAWARISSCYGDLRTADTEWDDDYVVTHWQPLPLPPIQKEMK